MTLVKNMSVKTKHLTFDTDDYLLEFNRGFILSKEEWEKIRNANDDFYNKYTGEQIDFYNNENEERLKREYEEEMQVFRNRKKVEKTKKPGCVYFIGCNETGVKIGYSTNVKGRFKTLNIASPYELNLITTIDCNNYEQVEKWAHEYFAPRRMNSEWFDITEEEINKWIGGLTRG